MGTPYAEVIGDPIIQSASPFVHNSWLRELDIEAEYRGTRVPVDALSTYLSSRRLDPDWRGCNVTMPLTQAITEHLDDLQKSADETGAVNFVHRQHDGLLVGANFDVLGFCHSHSRSFATLNAFADGWMAWEIIGAGGAARAVGAALVGLGFLHFFSRSVDDARHLAALFGDGADCGHDMRLLTNESWDPDSPYGVLAMTRSQRRTVIVNATPLGMTGFPPLPIRLDRYPPDTIVFDLNTTPARTPLIAEARRLGMPTVDGIEMLVEEAALSFEWLFDEPPLRDRDAELMAILRR